jgi:monoterpene epsilon-lactone hydrolase
MRSDTIAIDLDWDIINEIPSNDQAPSFKSRLIVWLLRLFNKKRNLASAAVVQEHVRQLAINPASYEPVGLGPGVDAVLETEFGWPVYHITPLANPKTRNCVVFLHGGGYINEIVKAHWVFIGHLTREAKAHCIVPVYPVAPAGTAGVVVPTIGKLLQQLLNNSAIQKITLMGNSAGAGMALAAAQWLRDSDSPQLDQLVLISPGIDASLNRPEHLATAPEDPLLDIPGIKEGARLYAGELGTAHPFISPLKAEMHDLPPMLIFAGTLDLLYPDSILLAAKARNAGVLVELHLRKGQPHNYAAMPTPEGREAQEVIIKAVAKSGVRYQGPA